MDILQKILDVLNAIPAPALAVGAGIVEFLLHRLPSDKALGFVHGIAALFSGASRVLDLIGGIVKKGAEILDKVVPQKPPAA